MFYLPTTVEPSYVLFFSGFCIIMATFAAAAVLFMSNATFVYIYTFTLFPAILAFLVLGLAGSFSLGYIPVSYVPYKSYISFFAGMLIFVTGINTITIFIVGIIINFMRKAEGLTVAVGVICMYQLMWELVFDYWVQYYLAKQDVYFQWIFMVVGIFGLMTPFLTVMLLFFRKIPFAIIVGISYMISWGMLFTHVFCQMYHLVTNWNTTISIEDKALYIVILIVLVATLIFKLVWMVVLLIFTLLRMKWDAITKNQPAS